MKIKKKLIVVAVVILAVAAFTLYSLNSKGKGNEITEKSITVTSSEILNTVLATGSIAPRNRLEVMPTVSGRIDSMLAHEGDAVHTGDILGWMSSSERAALIDAARLKGQKELKYWEESYKQIPIIAPIDGTVIVRDVEPGQSVTTSDTVYVISDTLVVSTNVDETDIGKVEVGQKATFTLDAHQYRTLNGEVTHISYESTSTNNVNMYTVQVTPDEDDAILRSGMTATVIITVEKKDQALILPAEAVQYRGSEAFVLVKENGDRVHPKPIGVGIITDDEVEVTRGLSENDEVFIIVQKSSSSKEDSIEKEGSSNPFDPQGGGPPGGGTPPSGPPPGGGGGPH